MVEYEELQLLKPTVLSVVDLHSHTHKHSYITRPSTTLPLLLSNFNHTFTMGFWGMPHLLLVN